MCFTRDSKGYIYKKNKLCISYGMLNIQRNIFSMYKEYRKNIEKNTKKA